MNVVWVIDNKYRDLYGLYSLKEQLKKLSVNLIIVNKYHWKYAIKLFDPHYVVLPNLYENSGLPMMKFCIKHKIKTILHNVEGFHLDIPSLKIYFPNNYIKKLHKIFVWCPQEKSYLIKIGFPKNKIIITGSLRYQGNYKNKFPSKIKTIGILSSNKYLSGRFSEPQGSTIINQLFRWRDEDSPQAKHTIAFMHYELDFINLIKNIIFKAPKRHNFLFRPHPFEDIKFYENNNLNLDKSTHINGFLNKVDILLNHYSSATIDALKLNIPVLSLEKILKHYQFKELDNFFSINLAYKVKSTKDLNYILKDKSFLKKYKNKYSEKFNKLFNKFHPTKNGINQIIKNFNFFKKKRKFNFLGSLLIFSIYEVYYIAKYNRDTAYRFYSFRDLKLLKSFNINYDK